MTTEELLVAVVAVLDGDSTLSSLISAGTGSQKIRYARSMDDDADPVLTVNPSPSVPGTVTGSLMTIISFDSWAKAEQPAGSSISDPFKIVVDMANRVKDIFTGRRQCNIPFGTLDSIDSPELVSLDQGEFWRTVVRIRYAH